ncbi:hypothetical protein [Mariniflexile sp.]|uniref:hypothetical protein n=1 Tax=Mariniflexile sp. TaxID=1979402 RepID=UPI0040480152
MKNKSTVSFYTFLFTILMPLISFNTAIAQEHGIFELGSNQNDRSDFYDLAFNLHSTYYITNNAIKKNIQNESSLLKLTFYDTNSFSLLNQNNPDYETVELISVNLKTINDLNNKLDLRTNASSFKNLKYIFIKSYFKSTEQQINDFVIHDSDIRIFYRVENPS